MYEVTYEMVTELLHRYLEKLYILQRHKGKSVIKTQQLYEMNQDLKQVIAQLEAKGHNADALICSIKEKLEKQYRYNAIQVYIDGAARGNDNPTVENRSGIAFAVYGDSQHLYEEAMYLGGAIQLPRLQNEPNDMDPGTVPATNNVVEYIALIETLQSLLEQDMKASHIEIFSDSLLVVSQVNMTAATRAPYLLRLRKCAQELIREFDNLSLTVIPREQNAYVDQLVNDLLDKEEKKSRV